MMKFELYRVTGRIRLGAGDSIVLKDVRQIEELKRLGVIEAEPAETYEAAQRIRADKRMKAADQDDAAKPKKDGEE